MDRKPIFGHTEPPRYGPVGDTRSVQLSEETLRMLRTRTEQIAREGMELLERSRAERGGPSQRSA
jgi:hypothetical protein